jgi:hypothetical protein
MADFIVPTIIIAVWIGIRVLSCFAKNTDYPKPSPPIPYKLFTRRMPIVWMLLVAFGLGVDTWDNNCELATGERIGMVTTFAKTGLVWKTWEGELAMEGLMSDGSHSHANVWDFSVDSQGRHGEDVEGLAKQIADLTAKGGKVRVKYVRAWAGWTWRGDTSYYVQSVEPVEK